MADGTTKRPRLIIDVTPDIRRRVKAQAALDDMTVSEWLLGLVMDELQEEEDIRVALSRLNDLEGTVPLEELHKERLQQGKQSAV